MDVELENVAVATMTTMTNFEQQILDDPSLLEVASESFMVVTMVNFENKEFIRKQESTIWNLVIQIEENVQTTTKVAG